MLEFNLGMHSTIKVDELIEWAQSLKEQSIEEVELWHEEANVDDGGGLMDCSLVPISKHTVEVKKPDGFMNKPCIEDWLDGILNNAR